MDIIIKLVSGEEITVKEVSKYECLVCGYWRIDVGDNAMFFNKELVTYIGNKDICFY